MAFTRFNDATDFNGKGARSLPDQPTISAEALKKKFDEDARDVVAPKVNVIVGELEDPTASASLGAVAPTGFSGSTVQAVINSIASGVGTAVADAHTHSNKMLLDTYTQTETNLADAVTKKHDHSNKSLLDTYEQTETNLADAVSKKHAHSNKTVLDDLSDSSGNLYYKGNPISGGGSGDMAKTDYAKLNITDTVDKAANLYDGTNTLSASITELNTLDGITASTAELNILDGVTASASELNILDGATLSTTELNYVDGVTSAIQTQLNNKSAVSWNQITGASGNTKIATITIDSTPTDIYAPSSGGGGGATSFAGLDDVSLSGSPSAGQIVQYTTVGADVKLRNVAMPTIPTAVSQLSNDSGFQNASDVSTAISTAIGGLDVTTSGAGAGKTLSALSETDGKISATFQNISITKSQVSDFPAIPDGLADLTDDVAISGTPSQGQALIVNSSGKWENANLPSGGHTMTPTPGAGVNEASIVSAIGTAVTEGGENDDVVSAYGVGKWTNVKTFRRVALGSDGDIHATGIGTWTDADPSSITTADEATWWEDEAFYIPSSGVDPDSVEIKFLFEPLADGTPIALGGYLWDTDYVHDNTHYGRICIKFANDITGYTSTAKVAVDITYTRNEVV